MIVIIDREDRRRWSVFLKLIVGTMPTAMKRPKPKRGEKFPWLVFVLRDGEHVGFSEHADEASARKAFAEAVENEKRLVST